MTIRQAASDYKEEIREGIAWVAIWQSQSNGRRNIWCAREFWVVDVTNGGEPIPETEDIPELEEILQSDSGAVLLNGYYHGWWGDYTIENIANAFRAHYEAGNFLLADALEEQRKKVKA